MQHVSQLANQASPSEQPKLDAGSSSANQPNARLMVNLWERLNHIYPNKFSAACGISAVHDNGALTDVAQTWASGLHGISGKQLAVGLGVVIASGREWPPSLPEFRVMCLPARRDPIHRDYIALPRPAQDTNVVENSLRAMRDALAGSFCPVTAGKR